MPLLANSGLEDRRMRSPFFFQKARQDPSTKPPCGTGSWIAKGVFSSCRLPSVQPDNRFLNEMTASRRWRYARTRLSVSDF